MLNNSRVAQKKIEELSDIKFSIEKNENIKKKLLSHLSSKTDDKDLLVELNSNSNELVKEINENSNIKMIIQSKSDHEILEILDELILELKDMNNLKKIESLESKLINNLDESSYSELIKLKSQLNRD